MEIEDKIREIYAEIIADESVMKDITDDTDLLENEIIDSMSIILLISELEGCFDVGEIDVDDIVPENFSSISRTIAFVRRLLDR